MPTERIDLPKIPVYASEFINNHVTIFTDTSTSHERGHVIFLVTRDGTITIVRYVPCDIYPWIKKPEKVQKKLELHLAGDTIVRFVFATVTDATELVDLISRHILSPDILTVRDADGFIVLTPRGGNRPWHTPLRIDEGWRATMRVSVINAPNDTDSVIPSIISMFTTLSDEKVDVSYNTERRNIIMAVKRDRILEASKFIGAITAACHSIGISEQTIDDVCSKCTYPIDLDNNYSEEW